MEEQAIKDGFASLKDGSCYDSLYQSALCRAKADWLVGINASRLFSVLYNQNLKVGRVPVSYTHLDVYKRQGLERLEIMYHVFNQDRIEPFKFQYKMLPETGLKTKRCV